MEYSSFYRWPSTTLNFYSQSTIVMIKYDSLLCALFTQARVVPVLNRYTLFVHFMNQGITLPGQLSLPSSLFSPNLPLRRSGLQAPMCERDPWWAALWVMNNDYLFVRRYLAGSWNYSDFMAKALREIHSQTMFQHVRGSRGCQALGKIHHHNAHSGKVEWFAPSVLKNLIPDFNM